MSEPVIETRHLTKCYSSSSDNALDDVTLSIEQGCFFGLLGPNGSGKTTFISILCGLLTANAGDAFVCGHEVKRELALIKPLIGLVPQKIALYPELTLKENLNLFARLYGFTKQKIMSRMDDVLQIVQLEEVLNKRVGTFSGGMLRRANLAVGLLHQPKVLFLDEPTVNVDVQARNMIFKSLRQINQQGVSIIYTTHYLEEVEMLCSKVAILDSGRMILHDTLANIRAQHPDKASLSEIYLTLTGEHLRG